ncbi:MAG: hypothetical protein JNJ45_11095 [Chthonomonas sp.]|nr:hypothetical protein [Chthonomonas sp.]
MYLLNWDQENNAIEASLGGVITAGEVSVMVDDLVDEFVAGDVAGWEFVLDTTFVKRFDEGAHDQINRLRDLLAINGARLVFVAEDQSLVEALTSQNLQAVLEGREIYRMAA